MKHKITVMDKKYIFGAAAVAASLIVASCGRSNEFKVSGEVAGGSDTVKMVVEQSSNGRWLIVDSVMTSGEGQFDIGIAAPANPEIYRLRYGRDMIYFPVDSLEHITINTDVKNFATGFTVGGSRDAVSMMNIDKRAIAIGAMRGDERAQAIASWKKELVDTIIANPSGIVSYYIINKYIGSDPLFDPLVKEDLRIIGAVANGYYTFRPNDPRTAYLVNLLRNGRVYHNPNVAASDTLQIEETSLFDINLQDNEGVEQSLASLAGERKVILLNFTVYTAEFSPAYNALLADIYSKYKGKGLEIYQLSYDADEFQWRQSAVNLPWITVYDPAGVQSQNLSKYNVTQMPLTYVIDRNGEIVERVSDPTQLQAAVAKYL